MPELHPFEASDDEVDPLAHKKLLDNVTRLSKTQFIQKPSRTEPSSKKNEFLLSKTKTNEIKTAKDTTISVPDLVKVLNKNKKHSIVGKALRKDQKRNKVLDKPLEKPEQLRIQRILGYERAKKNLNRWNAIVTRNTAADHLSFPLQQGDSQIDVIDVQETRPTNFRIKSDLMREMEALQPMVDDQPELLEAESSKEKMSREEMIARSKEMRLQRVRESQRSAKARKQNKIKSKKFHKIMKKEKMKEQMKNFEILQKTNPEMALQKLEEFEKNRVLERALLRHKNTGTWAKNLKVRAKYDQDVRKELAQQLALSRELTQKKPISDDESGDEQEATAKEPDNEFDAFNPWIKVTKNNENVDNDEDADLVGGYRKYWQERNANEEALRQYQKEELVIDESEDSSTIEDNFETEKTSVKATKMKKSKKPIIINGWTVEECSNVSPIKKKKRKSSDSSNSIENIDDLFDDAEEILQQKITNKLKNVREKLSGKQMIVERDSKKKKSQNHNDLSFKKQAKRPNIDEELEETIGSKPRTSKLQKDLEDLKKMSNASGSENRTPNDANESNINPNNFMNIRTHHLQTAIPDMTGGFEDEEDEHLTADQRMTITEAFEDDDIVADFQREKDEENKKSGPQQIDLTLPGWGTWAGAGIKAKSKKLILKFPEEKPRREENKGDVVIIENDNKKLHEHLVSEVPFPFTSVKEFEASIRAPMGREFVPMSAHKQLTKPAVETKLGMIINPMDESMLLQMPKKPRTRTEKRIAELKKKNGLH